MKKSPTHFVPDSIWERIQKRGLLLIVIDEALDLVLVVVFEPFVELGVGLGQDCRGDAGMEGTDTGHEGGEVIGKTDYGKGIGIITCSSRRQPSR